MIWLLMYGTDRFPANVDHIPQDRSRIGRGFHPKRKAAK